MIWFIGAAMQMALITWFLFNPTSTSWLSILILSPFVGINFSLGIAEIRRSK